MEREAECKHRYITLLAEEDSKLRQISRVQWLSEGDTNSKFFHALVKNRQAYNTLKSVKNGNGDLIEDPVSIKLIAEKFYDTLFNQPFDPELHHIQFKRLVSNEANQWLCREVTKEEIASAVKNGNPNKSPGPDGFNYSFFQKNWELVEKDVVEAVQHYYRYGVLLPEVNNTFLSLIPKQEHASDLSQFRPISCCNVIYKVITKILAARLQVLLPELISNTQHAFIKGRRISDSILLATEMVRGFESGSASNRVCLKVDITKAFDSISRQYILHVMRCMGFARKWIMWVEGCISKPWFSVLINGCSTGHFSGSRGIRQGDPLSPFLFCLAMEGLTVLLEREVASGKIDLFSAGSRVPVSHLIFADDIMVFCRANEKSMRGVEAVFKHFEKMSGLAISKQKSSMFFNKSCSRKSSLTGLIGIREGSLPIKYLGLPLTAYKLRHGNCSPLIEKIRRKLSGWQSRLLSFSGRLELLKTVIQSYLYYWCACFQLPKRTLELIDSLMREFLWQGSMPQISWGQLCRPKAEGGVGLRCTKDIAAAATLKLVWCLLSDRTSLWSMWIHDKYIRDSSLWTASINANHSPLWKSIAGVRQEAIQLIQYKLGSGNLSFWNESWYDGGCLRDVVGWEAMRQVGYPSAMVKDFFNDGRWSLPQASNYRVLEVWEDIEQHYWLGEGNDVLEWNKGGKFSFHSAWDFVRDRFNEVAWAHFVWYKHHNPRLSCNLYRAIIDRLPTRVRLLQHGILTENRCILCENAEETRDHLFFLCSYSGFIWQCIRLKFLLPQIETLMMTEELNDWIQKFGGTGTVSLLARYAFAVAITGIWEERNRRIFEGLFTDKASLKDSIIARTQELIRLHLRSPDSDYESRVLDNWG